MKKIVGLCVIILLVLVTTYSVTASQDYGTLDAASLKNAIAIGEMLSEPDTSCVSPDNSCPNPYYNPNALDDMKSAFAAKDEAQDAMHTYDIKVTSAKKVPDLFFGEGWQVEIENNTGYTIDALDVRMKFENAYHEQIVYLSTAYNDTQISDVRIANGSTYTNIGTEYYLSFPTLGFDTTDYLFFTISKYHTADGETVSVPSSEYAWFMVER